jgi:hypothetical protein
MTDEREPTPYTEEQKSATTEMVKLLRPGLSVEVAEQITGVVMPGAMEAAHTRTIDDERIRIARKKVAEIIELAETE